MPRKNNVLPLSLAPVISLLFLLFLLCGVATPNLIASSGGGWLESSLARKEDRVPLVVTEDGEVSAVDIFSGRKGPYHLQFFTLEPNSLFLPVLLHADMVLYVHTGSGRLSWTDDGKDMRVVNLRRGDLYRLEPGSVFFLHSNLDTKSEREKLRIHAIFTNSQEDIYEPAIGAYSSISDLVLGFDTKVLQSAFKVSGDVIDEISSAPRPPAIVHGAPTRKKKKPKFWRLLDARLLNSLVDARSGGDEPFGANDHKKNKAFNVYEADPDFQNPNGWSLTVNKGDMKSLKGSHVSAFMVNLTRGSMMGPHWNPISTEIGIVLHGEGMVRVVCPGTANETDCKNARFRVREGDVFAVPRFHPMAQMSFNNDSFVFMGFSTTTKKNHPQFLVGRRSVFQALNREVLAMSFNVTNATVIDELFNAQEEAVIVQCASCAEEEESVMEEELEREREEEEEERKREEDEEARRREEEEARKRAEEEERKREEEEEARRREEEEARKREEEKEREEEAAERAKEERRRREEEAMREQEEARRQEEESARRRREREEEARRTEEEEREPEEEEAGGGGGEEERERREEEAMREQEEARRHQKERERRRREREEEARRREEEEREPEEEEKEAGGGEEEREWREQEEARRREEERRRQQEEEEAMQREEEERQMREEMAKRREERQRHEKARRQEEVRRRREEAQREQEEARRQAEERKRRRQPEPWEQEGGEGEEERQEQEQEYGGGGWRRALRKTTTT